MRDGLEEIPGLTVGKAPANQDPIWLYLPVVIDPCAFGCDRDEPSFRNRGCDVVAGSPESGRRQQAPDSGV